MSTQSPTSKVEEAIDAGNLLTDNKQSFANNIDNESLHETSQIDLNKTLAEQLAVDEQTVYEKSRQQQEDIEEEIRRSQPLVSEKEKIDILVAEYDPETSQEFFQKASDLVNVYTKIRKIRGDGNCFYRAMLVAQLERCIIDPEELQRFTEKVKGWRKKLLDLGMPELTTSDFCDITDQILDGINNGSIEPHILFERMNDEATANYYVCFLRLIASGYLRQNSDIYSGFIDGARSLDQYCQEEIEAMWRECDHLSIIALVNAMGVSIRIEYMDRTQAPDGGWHHEFLVDGETTPKLWFLYRPGHYDILYPIEQPLLAEIMN